MMILIHIPLAELITTYPDIAGVLQAHHIDLREHQHTSLAQLLHNKSLSRTDFITELQKALITSACAQYKIADVSKLTQDIVKRFHEPHRAQMYGLISDARYIEKKYPDHVSCPLGLSALLVELFDDLANHMEQEELFLFPALVTVGAFNMFSQLAVAHHSHDRHINLMAKLNTITHNLNPPSDASVRWQELYENLLEFILQLNMHIAIENQLLLND
ncbi:MAG TPA: hemerythrin domain-containing protein [Cellvibrio sp.]|jgi:regulator of cell morphogenesis and NO signaling|nr:hemerythrin domain-containing protein [Cellvibrio sp.]